MSEQSNDPVPIAGAPLAAPTDAHQPQTERSAHTDYRKYGFFGATLAVATPIAYYGFGWWGFAKQVPLSIAAIAALGFILYLSPHVLPTLNWLGTTIKEKLLALVFSQWLVSRWRRVVIAAALAGLICIDTTGFWYQPPTEAGTRQEQTAQREKELREKHDKLMALVEQLLKKAEQLEHDRLAAIEAERVAKLNTHAYIEFKASYFEELLSSRSDTNECKDGCIGGKSMTIWQMMGLDPKPQAPGAKHKPLKIMPSVTPSTRHIY